MTNNLSDENNYSHLIAFNKLPTKPQGNFIVGCHTYVVTHPWLFKKYFGISDGIPHTGSSQAPSNEINPAKQVLPGEKHHGTRRSG